MMERITIRDVQQATGARLLADGLPGNDVLAIPITGVSTDTRTIRPGDLFVALVGERFDGNAFVRRAVEAGAAAALISSPQAAEGLTVPMLLAPYTLAALGALASWYRRRFPVHVVGVTGSTGKTTTKDMIASVLGQAFCVLKTQGNQNNEIGLPLSLFRLDGSHQAAVIEMGMNHAGEIERLSRIALPRTGVITNVGVAHIEHLGSRENILKAKCEMFSVFGADSEAFVNGDDDMLRTCVGAYPFPVRTFGLKDPLSDVWASEVEDRGLSGSAFTVRRKDRGDTVRFRLAVPGLHNVYNALAAISVGFAYGLSPEQVADGLLSYAPDPNRLHLEALGNVRLVNDAYNANPDSMKAAFSVLSSDPADAKAAVLGDMLELGDHAQSAHEDVGRLAAQSGVDGLFLFGEQSRYALDAARDAGFSGSGVWSLDKSEIEQAVRAYLREKQERGARTAVLVKGSHGMKMETFVEFIRRNA